jgi:predicted transcriptional regulator
MTLRLDEKTNEALRQRAESEGTSMQELVKLAIVEYIERHSRQEQLDRVLADELPRFADALRRLGE